MPIRKYLQGRFSSDALERISVFQEGASAGCGFCFFTHKKPLAPDSVKECVIDSFAIAKVYLSMKLFGEAFVFVQSGYTNCACLSVDELNHWKEVIVQAYLMVGRFDLAKDCLRKIQHPDLSTIRSLLEDIEYFNYVDLFLWFNCQRPYNNNLLHQYLDDKVSEFRKLPASYEIVGKNNNLRSMLWNNNNNNTAAYFSLNQQLVTETEVRNLRETLLATNDDVAKLLANRILRSVRTLHGLENEFDELQLNGDGFTRDSRFVFNYNGRAVALKERALANLNSLYVFDRQPVPPPNPVINDQPAPRRNPTIVVQPVPRRVASPPPPEEKGWLCRLFSCCFK
ncbi:hypothetical protein GEMRC1_013273 [Eukaryota sp. GEM-RC1]